MFSGSKRAFRIEGSTGQGRKIQLKSIEKKKRFFTPLGTLYVGPIRVYFCDKRSRLKNELGRNIGATTEKLCGSKKFPASSLNYGLRRGVEVLC